MPSNVEANKDNLKVKQSHRSVITPPIPIITMGKCAQNNQREVCNSNLGLGNIDNTNCC